MKNILIIIVLAFQFLSCNEEQINSANNENNEIKYTISGTISESDNPIDSVQIIVNDSTSTFSNEDGYFQVDSLLAGSYLVTFKHELYKQKDTTIILNSDTVLNIELTEKKIDGYTLCGTISESNNPIDSVQVILNNSTSTLSNEDGYFQFDSLLAGSYLITFQHDLYKQKDTTIILNSDTVLNIELRKKILDDYFPLYKGYQCSFYYRRIWHNSAQPPIYDIDTITWVVTDSVNNDTSITYFLSEKMEGKEIIFAFAGNDYTYDTLSITPVLIEFNFEIEEFGDTAIISRQIQYNESFLWGTRKLKTKYYDNNDSQIVFKTDNYSLTLEKGVGIKSYYYESVRGNNWDEIEVIRIK